MRVLPIVIAAAVLVGCNDTRNIGPSPRTDSLQPRSRSRLRRHRAIGGRDREGASPDGDRAIQCAEDALLPAPPGFTVEVVARVPNARFLLQLPKKEFLVSSPNNGTITLVRPRPNNTPLTFTFASGLRRPHDMVLATINGTRYLYVAESHQVSRSIYGTGDNAMRARTVVVGNLPRCRLGGYGHPLKNIALDQGKLYVSIASTCNACLTTPRATRPWLDLPLQCRRQGGGAVRARAAKRRGPGVHAGYQHALGGRQQSRQHRRTRSTTERQLRQGLHVVRGRSSAGGVHHGCRAAITAGPSAIRTRPRRAEWTTCRSTWTTTSGRRRELRG